MQYSKTQSPRMMQKIEIKPLQGIEILNLGQINLRQEKGEIEKILGTPLKNANNNQSFYDDYELRIDYDELNKAEFIEFLFGPFPKKTELKIYGHDPFKIKAEELIKILTRKNDGPVDSQEAEYGYSFLNISVGIWREAIPTDIEELVAEMKQKGKYEKNKNWIEEELEKSRHFWTIGIGKKNYYD